MGMINSNPEQSLEFHNKEFLELVLEFLFDMTEH